MQKDDLISRQAALDALGEEPPVWYDGEDEIAERNQWRRDVAAIKALPSPQPGWIPVTERLPEIHQKVILSLTDGTVIVGFQGEPDCIWQVTEKDGEKSWVYDPESYTDDIDSLPTAKDCWFDTDGPDGMSYTSITSLTHRAWCTGVAAWQPLPKPYWEGGQDGKN